LWAGLFGAAVRFHYVIPDEESLYTAAGVQVAYRSYLTTTEERAKESFAKVVAEGWKGIETETRVTVGLPADAILASAKEFAAELIVLGTHVKPRVDIFRIGSIALRILRHAPCPVLAVRMSPASP
jgi:nucleotide-binding universal stress UspA family protein